MGSFIKGTCLGLVAGASIGIMMTPATRRKITRYKTRIFRTVGDVIDNAVSH